MAKESRENKAALHLSSGATIYLLERTIPKEKWNSSRNTLGITGPVSENIQHRIELTGDDVDRLLIFLNGINSGEFDEKITA